MRRGLQGEGEGGRGREGEGGRGRERERGGEERVRCGCATSRSSSYRSSSYRGRGAERRGLDVGAQEAKTWTRTWKPRRSL